MLLIYSQITEPPQTRPNIHLGLHPHKYHALIFSEKKKGAIIIGVMVRLRFFPLRNCKFEKKNSIKKIKKYPLNNHMIMDGNFESLTK